MAKKGDLAVGQILQNEALPMAHWSDFVKEQA